MTITTLRAWLLALAGVFCIQASAVAAPSIIPWPAEVTSQPGAFKLTARTQIHTPVSDEEALRVGLQLSDLLVRAGMPRLRVVSGGPTPAGAISLARSTSDGEDYAVRVTPSQVEITAGNRSGLFYGAMTVWQLATQDSGAREPALPAMTITDSPRYAWRGLMIDSARHFQTIDELKRLIDAMAVYKLNVLHWHLTDDQGWRLEIKAYPKLTTVGAWRAPKGADAARPAPRRPQRYGGFYTQDQVRDLIAYAQARGVMIVPEIELPGHATAALTAYPQFGVTGATPTSGMSDWGVYSNLYGTDEATFTFLETILDEVVALFPSRYIHIGGDEAIKNQWQADPRVQARMKALGLENEDKLQSWFIGRISAHLAKKDRRVIGWDEILEGGADADAIIMAWRGVDRAAVAARLGHDTILTPHPQLYLDSRQSLSAHEPPGRSEISTLQGLYGFDPRLPDLTADQQRHVLGVQANAFTEHMRTAKRLETMTFPRLTAVAELGWTPKDRRDWSRYSAGLPVTLRQLDLLGVAHDDTPFEPEAVLSPSNDGLSVNLASPLDLGEIRYVLGGAAPTAASPLYAGPLTLANGTRLRARTFLNGQPLGGVRDFEISTAALATRNSAALKACGDSVPLRLEADFPAEGSRPVFTISIYKPCWIWQGADLSKGLTLRARVGQVPFNFQLAGGRRIVQFAQPQSSPYGELVVRKRTGSGALCEGETLAVVPMTQAAARKAGLSEVVGHIPPTPGVQDLCFAFNRPSQETLWAIDEVSLTPP
jgi:hexosaminidase